MVCPSDYMIQKMVDQNTYDCLGMYVDGELKGYACLVREPDSSSTL